jgi:hypothetical protein
VLSAGLKRYTPPLLSTQTSWFGIVQIASFILVMTCQSCKPALKYFEPLDSAVKGMIISSALIIFSIF